MSNKENKIRVEIFGTNYLLKSEDEVEYMQKLAAYVDKKMKDVQQATGLMSSFKIAILTALHIADELYKSGPAKKKEIMGEDNSAMARKAFELIEKIEKELK